ncbi:aminotransferase [Thecamonas trahens ATCC 50062]|uniref:Aminotransferase n=1 Tax=Thecamonas trahens ATCC 50062 TaxID=461836 RepID=A0A0L0D263_THETB|nr:aminotransferase [Thecamonas trahens ATCC 50062]KNC46210.1 aminotransferase [Thecamonas trahens ATCC 50062]|eukprot:XP_013760507.1 aminotransferase [Thecamonas trahens ATCC 50062]
MLRIGGLGRGVHAGVVATTVAGAVCRGYASEAGSAEHAALMGVAAGSGTSSANFPIAKAVQGLGKSPTLAINELSAAKVAAGEDVVRFGFGQSPFPVPGELVEALQRHAAQKDYEAVQGLAALQACVASEMAGRIGRPVAAEDIMVGPGSKELLFNLQVAIEGTISIPAASWVSYLPQSLIAGRAIDVVPTARADGWKLTPEVAEAHFVGKPGTDSRASVLILNYPSNPTGLSYSASELEALAGVFRKHNVIVLADEIYGKVHHTGQHASLASAYPEGTIVSDGLSKWAGAGGWRLGHFCFPRELRWLRDAMHVVASETFSATSAPIQYAATAAYPGEASEPLAAYLEGSRAVLKAVGGYVADAANAAGMATPKPDGGFYVFPSFNDAHGEWLADAKGISTNVELAHTILAETGVAMLPGAPFSVPHDELSLRLAFVDFDGAAALDAYAATGHVDVAAVAPKVVRGMDRLAAWCGAR